MRIKARRGCSVGEAVDGALYLLCVAVFPLDVLPVWLRWIGETIPLAYWMEAIRRSLIGTGSSDALDRLSNGALLAVAAGSSIARSFSAFCVYGLAERRARGRGLIDM